MADGDQKLRDMAVHIAMTLGRSDTMTEDILETYSTFDDRFSRSKLYQADSGDSAGAGAPSSASAATVERNLRYVERQISRFISSQRPIWSDSGDAASFLDSIDMLLETLRGLDPMVPVDRKLLEYGSDVLHKSAQRLEAEFKILVEQGNVGSGAPLDPFTEGGGSISPPYESDEDDGGYIPTSIPVAQPVTDYNVVIEALPRGTISDLREIARRMVAAGFARDCARVFAAARREFLEESVARLGVGVWTAGEVQGTQWGDLEAEIPRWVQACKVAFRILFPSERRLAEKVFEDLGPVADAAFAEAVAEPTFRLLGFADSVASGTKSPERLFRIIDMYEALSILVPEEINVCFVDPYTSSIRDEAFSVCERLGKAIREIFTELEKLITRDPPGTTPVPGAGLHPITRYVMNYLRTASASWRILEEVMDEDGLGAAASGSQQQQLELRRASSFSVQISWIMKILMQNLDAKAGLYRGDTAMRSIFLMNNTKYIIQKVVGSELEHLMGEGWIRQQATLVRKLQSAYHKNTWTKVALQLQMTPGGGGYGADAVREKVQLFCTQLEEICRVQTGWTVYDEAQREEIKKAAVDTVVPGYRGLMGRVRGSGREAVRHMERHVKYSVDDVQDMIGNLFQGPPQRNHR